MFDLDPHLLIVMKLYISFLVVGLFFAAALTPDDPMYTPPRKRMYPQLQIGVLKKVENCTQRVQRGDEVEVCLKNFLKNMLKFSFSHSILRLLITYLYLLLKN